MKKIVLIVITLVLTITLSGCLYEGSCDCSNVTFTLNGENVIELTTGQSYVEQGFIALSGESDLSAFVTVSGEVDSRTEGTYFIEYVYSNNGEEISLLRAIIVTETDVVVDPDVVLYDGTCDDVEIHFIDLGSMGDATLIDCGDFEVLIDAGLKSVGTDIIVPYLNNYIDDGILELAVATHPDADHFGGYVGSAGEEGVFDAFQVDRVLDFGYEKSTTVYNQYIELRDNEGALVCSGSDALNSRNLCQPYFTITEDLILRVIDTGHYDGEDTTNDNENSIVLLLEHKDLTYLFTGDAEHNAELIMKDTLSEVDVYKAGHHGSHTASSATFLEVINPDTIILSVFFPDDEDGENGYGIPQQESVDRLYSYTDDIYATGTNGNIVITSDGTTYSITGSDNSTLFKDSTWFTEHRTLPSN